MSTVDAVLAAVRDVLCFGAPRPRQQRSPLAIAVMQISGLYAIEEAAVMHDCNGGCGRQVPYDKPTCRQCWAKLPQTIYLYELTSRLANDNTHHDRAMSLAAEWFRLKHWSIP